MKRAQRIILTGFSGTGKSEVARLVAERLGWQAVDSDDAIVEAAGKPIPAIFRDDGETHFRTLEHSALRELCSQPKMVIAAGGGAILSAENRQLMAQNSFIVCLEARPETILTRLRPQFETDPVARPLLATSDPLSRIRELKSFRQPYYALADQTIHTDGLTMEQVAGEVVHAWRQLSATALADEGRVAALVAAPSAREADAPYCQPPAEAGAACVVRTSSATYPVFVSWGALPDLGRRMADAGLASRAYLISDSMVHARWGAAAKEALKAGGFTVAWHVVPAGETSKSLDTAAAIYDWLVSQRAERGEAIVALGGGMVCDLAGFVAATFVRGLPLVHVPTSLLAMVDAAIGGKVAVNQKEAKNLIGAFYQPRLVLADVSTLQSLPPRELTAGWAEVIKHALIMDEELLRLLEENADAIVRLEPAVTAAVISGSIALKAAVVSEDEREERGRRTILNYGHTIGHGLEAAAEYTGMLHGEAVAVGMTGAARIARRLGLLPPELAERQDALIARFGLPLRASGVDPGKVMTATALDKKVKGGAIRWVLLEGIGRPVIRHDVPPKLAEEVVQELLSA
ncbi:MAG: 3-dehydroquinate synthase [Dehalococcoidia bacterium]|nr:MAG: 3-dehydroquinate synthase [Dehalococcoidia bacterium]